MPEPTPGDEALIRAYLTAQQAPAGQRADAFQQFLATQPQGALPSPFVQGAPSTAPDLSALASPVDPAKQVAVQKAGGIDLNTLPPAQAAQTQALLPPSAQPAPKVRQGTTQLLTPQQAQAMVRPKGGVSSPAGPPPWLKKAMGAEAEGVVRQPKGLTVQPLTAEGKAALDEADTELFAAKRAQGEAAIQGAQDIADQSVKAADEQEAVAARFAEREAERQRHIATMEADYRDMADRIVNTPIEQPDFWGGTDAGHQILGRIALFLGTIGSGVSGQPNLAWQKLSGDVERNIEVQKANKALQTNRLAAEGTLIGMARERFASAAAQDAVMRQAAYEKIRMQLEAYKEQARTPERVAALDALMAEADQALTQADEQRRQLMETGELNERRARAAMMARPDPLDVLDKRTAKLARIAQNTRTIEGGPDPKDMAAVPLWNAKVPKELAKDAISQAVAYRQSRSALQALKEAGRTGKDFESAKQRFVLAYKNTKGSGMGDEAAMERMSAMLPGRASPDFDGAINKAATALDQEEMALKQGYGVAPTFAPKTEVKR